MSSSARRPQKTPESVSTSAESVSASSASADAGDRPALVGPPKRPVAPVRPVAPSASPAPLTAAIAADAEPPPEQPPEPSAAERPRQQPISPPSEPMQYRAIGLLRGRYVPSEEAFNRGQMVTHDGVTIQAVLLGRITSLVKKYLDMETNHLWVVYPRTNPEENNALSVQIVGVWEPETLSNPEAAADDDEVEAGEDATAGPADSSTAPSNGEAAMVVPADEVEADVFSIRGEVSKYNEEKGEITISILQKMRSGPKPQRTFRLLINGSVEEKTIGYFWDFDVRREGDQLVVHQGSYIAAVPPKKKAKRKRRRDDGEGSVKRRPMRREEGREENRQGDRPIPKPKPASPAPSESPADAPESATSPEE